MHEIQGIERVKRFVAESGLDTAVQGLDGSTRSSALAAQALGCSVAEIAKSVVFCGELTVVVVISGDRRVDASKLAALIGGPLRVASPDEVRTKTGYVIGGVPPFRTTTGCSCSRTPRSRGSIMSGRHRAPRTRS